MVPGFCSFFCLFLFTIGKLHISFFPSSSSILLYLFCAQVPFLFRCYLFSVFLGYYYSTTTLLLSLLYLPISACSIQFYTRYNSSFVTYFFHFLSQCLKIPQKVPFLKNSKNQTSLVIFKYCCGNETTLLGFSTKKLWS